MQLHFADHVVLVAYLGAMMFLGWRLSRGQKTGEEYFLGGRQLPWFAVGISIIASLLSSISFLSLSRRGLALRIRKPSEHLPRFSHPRGLHPAGNHLTIPFFVRFRFTTAYEAYLEHRYGLSAMRLLGASMFLVFVSVG